MSTSLASAISRLTMDLKEIQKNPIAGVSAIPLEDNIFEWHCNIQYEDTYFHMILTFPETYPAKSPSCEIMPNFRFTQGATREGRNGGTRICLNIFSDFAEIHTEWANEKGTGWSVSYTTQIVLLNLLSFLQEARGGFYSYGKGAMDENVRISKAFECKTCGHSLKNVYPPMPTDLKVQAAPPSADPTDDIVCYISKASYKSAPPTEVWGVGISKTGKAPNFNLTSPCEWMNYSAYKELKSTGSVESVFRETIDYFLPLYISPEHWKIAFPLFKATMKQVLWVQDDVQAIFKTLPKLLNSSVVLYMNSSNAHVSENALNGYFLFVQVFKEAIKTYPKLQDLIEETLKDFTTKAAARTKSQCPNIGELLALLVVSQKMTFEQLASAYINENFLRNVMWYTRSQPSLAQPCSDQTRLDLTFKETKVSRDLAVFQVCFLRALKLDQSPNGYPTSKQKEYLLQVVKDLKQMTNYSEWFDRIGVKYPGNQAIAAHLWDSVQKSQKMDGYFFSNTKSKGNYNNNNNNRGNNNYRGNNNRNNRGRGNRY